MATRLIDSLIHPRANPANLLKAELVETHISWVLLTDQFAYKIKKPVRLPFLDFSTLEQRKYFCELEVQLNQRLAPELYIGVVAITGSADAPEIEGQGETIEYAVKMRRFDESCRLDHLCSRNELSPGLITELARNLVRFHQSAAISPESSDHGSASIILKNSQANFDALKPLRVMPEWRIRIEVLEQWTQQSFDQLHSAFDSRKNSGRIRECHGDLHLGNLALINGKVTPFDCLEFSEELRWIDTTSEIAFIYLDLLHHGHGGLACWFANEYLSMSGDWDAVYVLRFYAVYRALVRAKVAILRAEQTRGSHDEAQGYVALAEKLAAPPAPRLVITHGLSGCGKTVASSQLLINDPSATTLRMRSDVERQRLAGNVERYQPQTRRLIYTQMLAKARAQLAAGWSSLVDATFLQRQDREDFQNLAKEMKVEFLILAPQASSDQLRERISQRLGIGNDASEATLEVLKNQMRQLEPLSSDEQAHLLLVRLPPSP